MPLNIDWKQILLHLFNFVLLFAILFFILYKPIKNFMNKRVQYYKDMDDEAKKVAADAEEMKKEYEQKLSNVEAELNEKKKEAEELVEKQRQDKLSRTKKEADEILRKARADGEEEKKKIIESAQVEIVDIVADACKKSLSGDPSDAMDGFLTRANEDK